MLRVTHRIQLVERGKLDWTELNWTELYCTVLYCIVLYCTVLYCTVLYCTVLYCWHDFYFHQHINQHLYHFPSYSIWHSIFKNVFFFLHSSNDLVCQTFGVFYNIYCSMSGTGNGTHYNMYKSQLLTAVFIIMLVLKNAYITLRKQLFVICLFIHSLIHLLFVSSFIHTYQNKITRNLNYPVILFT